MTRGAQLSGISRGQASIKLAEPAWTVVQGMDDGMDDGMDGTQTDRDASY